MESLAQDLARELTQHFISYPVSHDELVRRAALDAVEPRNTGWATATTRVKYQDYVRDTLRDLQCSDADAGVPFASFRDRLYRLSLPIIGQGNAIYESLRCLAGRELTLHSVRYRRVLAAWST